MILYAQLTKISVTWKREQSHLAGPVSHSPCASLADMQKLIQQKEYAKQVKEYNMEGTIHPPQSHKQQLLKINLLSRGRR